MDFSLDEIKQSKAFQTATPEEQQQVESKYTEDAWKEKSKDISYIAGTPETRQKFEEAFNVQHPMNVAAQTERENVDNTFLENMGLMFGQGTKDAIAGLRSFGDATLGIAEGDLAARIVESERRHSRAYTPDAYKTVQTHAAAVSKQWDAAKTFSEKLEAIGGGVAAVGYELATNPEGVAYLSAQSAANVLAPIATGAVAGAITSGPGAPLAALAGAVGGGYASEVGSEYINRISEEVKKRGLDFTEENVQSVLDDTGALEGIADKSRKKAIATATVDAVLSAGIGRLGSAPARALEKTAKQSLLKSAAKGITKKAGLVAAEGAGEAISEGAGQLAADKKIDAGGLVMETLGGIGSGPVTAPLDIAVHGTKQVTKGVADKVRSAVKSATRKKPLEEVAAIRQAKAPAEHKFKEKVAEQAATGDLGKTADPKAKEYNPLKATYVAKELNQDEKVEPLKKVGNLDKVNTLYSDLQTKQATLIKDAQALYAKEGATAEEIETAASMLVQAKANATTLKTMAPIIDQMTKGTVDEKVAVKDINAALESNDSATIRDSILSVFGSKQSSDLVESSALQKVLDNPAVDEATKQQIRELQDYHAAEKVLTKTVTSTDTKSVGDVNVDVIHGGPGFKGIQSYAQAISTALKANDPATATEQLKGLKAFAVRQEAKAKDFASGKSVNPRTGKPHSPALIKVIQQESDALNKAVTMLSSTVKGGGPTEATTTTEGIARATAEAIPTKGVVVESTTRTTETKAEPKEEAPSSKASMKIMITKADKVNLEAAGFDKASIRKMKPGTAGVILDNVNSTKEQITEAARSFAKDSPEREALRQLWRNRKGKPTAEAKATVEPKPINTLQSMGFKDTEIAKMTPEQGNTLAKYAEMSPEQLVEAGRALPKGSKEKELVRKAWLVNKRKTKTKETTDAEQGRTDSTQEKPQKDQDAQEVVQEKKEGGTTVVEETERQRELSQEDKKQESIRDEDTESIKRDEDRTEPLNVELTTPDEADPNNVVKETFKADKKKKGLIQKAKNVIAALTPEVLKGSKLFDEKTPFDKDTAVVVKSLNNFLKSFHTAVDSKFKVVANKDYRFKDPVQYLLDNEDNPPPAVVDAIATVSFKWLATRASETVLNEEDDIRSILGVDENVSINALAHQLIGTIGSPSSMLSESLGAEILKTIGIIPTDASPTLLQNKLELSLGLQALRAMQTMGYIEQLDVYRDSLDGKPVGLMGVVNSLTSDSPEYYDNLKNNFFVPEGQASGLKLKGVGKAVFYRLVAKGSPKNKIMEEHIVKPFSNSKRTWDQLFNPTGERSDYTWAPPTPKKDKAKLKGTPGFVASQRQTDNLNTNSAKSYEGSARTLGIYSLLGSKNLDKIQGVKDPDTVHITKRKGQIGINRKVEGSRSAIENWIHEAGKQVDTYKSKFYINQFFARQGRMHQIGTINPQGDKDHRFLFGMSKWTSEIDLTDPKQVEQFMEGVALGLDQETSKEGGMQGAIDKAYAELKKPKIRKALVAISTVIDEQGSLDEFSPGEMEQVKNAYKTEMAAITEGVLETGMGMHGMKALIEYTRYLKAKAAGDTSFTTDLPTEIDGVSNGMTIARIQLIGAGASLAETVTAIQNAGGKFTNIKGGLGEHLQGPLAHDAYQSVGFAWAGALVDIENQLADKLANSLTGNELIDSRKEYVQLQAMKRLFGEFRDKKTGNVSQLVRKLSKDPTMSTVYGMGPKALLESLSAAFITSIYDKMTDVTTETMLDELRKDLREITGRNVFPKDILLEDGTINRKALLNTELSVKDIETINNHIGEYHGKALKSGITKVYGEIQNTFKSLNTGINIAAAMYNTVRKLKTQQLQKMANADESRILNPDGNREVTKGEMDALQEEIFDMFPHVVTEAGEKIPLAKMSREKIYSDAKTGLKHQEVLQTYKPDANGKSTPTKKAAPFKKLGVESPGVGGTILTIHDMDSLVANTTMGLHNILNNHDGFTTGVLEAREMGTSANDAFYNVMRNFDMGVALTDAARTVEKEFIKQEAALLAVGVTHEAINNEMVTQLAAMKIEKTPKVIKSKGKQKTILVDITANNYAGAIQQSLSEMQKTGETVRDNKNKILDAMVSIEQYSYPGSEYTTNNSPKLLEINGETLNPHLITAATEKRLNDAIEATNRTEAQTKEFVKAFTAVMAQEAKDSDPEDSFGTNITEEQARQDTPADQMDAYFSSPRTTRISTVPKDYGIREEISQKNVMETYDTIKDDSMVKDSPEHTSYLRNLLSSLVQKVMDPVDLFLKENPDIESEGVYVNVGNGKGRVFISSQTRSVAPVSGAVNQGIEMSTGEVYTHELVHAVIHKGLAANKQLRAKVEYLFRLTKQKLGEDGYKAFLNDPTIDVTDPAYADEVKDAKDRYDYIFNNTETAKTSRFSNGVDTATGIKREQETSAYLDEFMALGMTNENFMKALGNVKLTDSDYRKETRKSLFGNNLQETIQNFGQMIFDFVYSSFASRRGSKDVHNEMVELAQLLASKDTAQKGAIAMTIQAAGNKYSAATNYANEFVKNALITWPIVKIGHQLKGLYKLTIESDTILGQRMRERKLQYARLDQGIMKSIVTEMQGRTDRMGWVHTMLGRRNLFLDSAKEEETKRYTDMANELFTDLQENERTSITKVGLKADASVLANHLTMDGLLEVLKSKDTLNQKKKDLIDELIADKDLAPYATYYQRAADALGHFMIKSRGREGEVVFQSTEVIAALANTEAAGKLSKSQIAKAEGIIDKLTSLYAVGYTAKDRRDTFASLIEKDPDAVNGIFRMHEILKENSLRESFAGNKAKFIKGYTKQILNPRIGFTTGTLADEDALAKKGYTRHLTPIDRDPKDPTKKTDMYIYTSKTGARADYLSGVASVTSNTAKGTNLQSIASQMGMDTSTGIMNNAQVVKDKQQILNAMMDPKKIPSLKTGNYMVPAVNDKGTITNYRYMMAESTKDSYMEQSSDFAYILGSMAGQIIDKSRTPIVNEELVQGLKAMYDEEYDKNPGAYVEIGPKSDDPRLREIYYMLPPKARNEIKRVWGENRMYVAKDVVDIAFGYRQYSVAEAFTKDPKERAKAEKLMVAVSAMVFKDKAESRMLQAQGMATYLTKFAKSNIIVKSLHVTAGNLGSNMMYLKGRGVPAHKIIKLGWEAFTMGNKYQADSKKLGQLTLEREILAKGNPTRQQLKVLDGQIARVKDSISRNPTTVTIQAGLMPSLVDDVETVGGGNQFPTDFEKKLLAVEKKLSKTVGNVGRAVLLTEDTAGFKALNNAVKMTDYIGRHVLYNHYTQEGMSHEKAVAAVTDEFINFDIPTHRTIEYLNSIGLLWFTKYAFRVLKVVKESVVEKPVDVFLSMVMAAHMGLPTVGGSVLGISKDFSSLIGDPLSMASGSVGEVLTVNNIEAILQ